MPRTRVSKTLAADVYEQLRLGILEGDFTPGSRLKMETLTSELEVSRSVVREALNRLVEQGLVVLAPQIGFSVIELSDSDLRDLTEARIHVECLALTKSIGAGDLQWEQLAVGSHHALSRTPSRIEVDGEQHRNPDWIRAHADFHATLISACPNRRLATIANQLRDTTEIYRQWAAEPGTRAKRDVAKEHRELLDASIGRQTELASDLLGRHIQCTTDLLLAAVSRTR